MSDARRLDPEPCSALAPPAAAPSAPDGSRVAETVVTVGASVSPAAPASIAVAGCCWRLARRVTAATVPHGRRVHLAHIHHRRCP